MTSRSEADPVWEEKYRAGERNRWPWDSVVSFVFTNAPAKPRGETSLLEVGCGAGNNLLFAAREGFQVSGIEGSPSAVEFAKREFELAGLRADLRIGDFTSLPFPDASFDLVIDRGSLTCVGIKSMGIAIHEIRRCLRPGGKFFFNPMADSHSSYRSGTRDAPGVSHDIKAGALVGVGGIYFVSRREIDTLFDRGWHIRSIHRVEQIDMLNAASETSAEWRVVAQKD